VEQLLKQTSLASDLRYRSELEFGTNLGQIEMDQSVIDKISRTYQKHPINAARIIERIERQFGSTTSVTELDLATDRRTWATDQNHTGGLDSVLSLAHDIDITETDCVLDVGTGLGGTPRVLSHLYGCCCHGIELTEARYHDALQLTEIAGLQDRVTFTCGDFLAIDLPHGPYDVIIGQDTFMHFPDQTRVLKRCAELLKPAGTLVVDDGVLRREPANEDERRRLKSAWDHWNGHFHSLVEWQGFLEESGFRCWLYQNFTDVALREYQARLHTDSQRDEPVDPHEQNGWKLGVSLIETGLIGTMRLIAEKTKSAALSAKP